ncbi:MAG: hypothetical protein ACRDZ4_22335 [Egibacteraceae bacterium]
MTPNQLGMQLRAAAPSTGELVYLERRGDDYRWARGEVAPPTNLPDAWMYFTGEWPVGEDDRWAAFFDDLLAELDSMVIRADRCRWSLDDPWPHGGLRS